MRLKRIYIVFVFILSLFLYSCNEKSVIEGFTPEYNQVTLSQPILISNSGNYILSSISASCNLGFYINRSIYFGLPSGSLAYGDSLVIIQQNYGTATALMSIRNNCVAAYNAGDIIALNFTTNNYIIAVFNKKTPYSSNLFNTLSPYAGVIEEYKILQDSYLGFKYTDTQTNKTYYGWVLLQVSNKGVLIKGYGYQSFASIKAGE